MPSLPELLGRTPMAKAGQVYGRTEAEVCVGMLAAHGISSKAQARSRMSGVYVILVREPAVPLACDVLEGLPGVLVFEEGPLQRGSRWPWFFAIAVVAVFAIPALIAVLLSASAVVR